jgi:hypothetical protein
MKASNYPSPHPPNIEGSKGRATNIFLYIFIINYKCVQTSSKHPVLLQLHFLA